MDMDIPAFIWTDLKAVAGGPLEALAYLAATAIVVLAAHHAIQFATKHYAKKLDDDTITRLEALEKTACHAYASATQAERDVLKLRAEIARLREIILGTAKP